MKGAEATYRWALAIDPTDAIAHEALCAFFRDKNDNAGAERCVRALLAIHPTHPRAHNELGVLLMGRGDFKGAAAEFQAALALDPTNAAEVNENLGSVFGNSQKKYPGRGQAHSGGAAAAQCSRLRSNGK